MLKRFFNKMKKDGFLAVFFVILMEMKAFYLRWIPFPLRLTYYWHLCRLIFFPNLNIHKKRILGIWDYNCMPFSVGDPLLFVQALSVIKLKNNADVVDIAILYDKNNPIKRSSSNLTKENAQDYFIDFLPIFSTSPYMGSVLQFNERAELNTFLQQNISRYLLFPFLCKHLGETFNYGRGDYDIKMLIDEFFNKERYMPNLRVGERDYSWALDFYKNNLKEGEVPVCISLKNTSHSPQRNADSKVWLPFLRKCCEKFPEIKFIQIGLRGEEFSNIRKLKNVLIAKDFGSSLMEDFALIRASSCYLGTTSGIAKIAVYSSTPFLIFKMEPHIMKKLNVENGKGYIFNSHLQKFFDFNYKLTPEILFDDFSKIYKEIDLDVCRQNILQNDSIKHPHPTTQLKK